jgi:hypothetical protein
MRALDGVAMISSEAAFMPWSWSSPIKDRAGSRRHLGRRARPAMSCLMPHSCASCDLLRAASSALVSLIGHNQI